MTLPKPLNLESMNYGFLYKVDIELVEPISKARFKPYNPIKDECSLVLLVADKIPNFGPFSLFGPCGTIKVKMLRC